MATTTSRQVKWEFPNYIGYFDILAIIDLLLFQITDKLNLTWTQINLFGNPTLTLPGATSIPNWRSALFTLDARCQFKNLPKFDLVNSGYA